MIPSPHAHPRSCRPASTNARIAWDTARSGWLGFAAVSYSSTPPVFGALPMLCGRFGFLSDDPKHTA